LHHFRIALHQHRVHAEHVGHAQVIASQGLLGQFAVEAVELIQAGCE
jgi:hypothetical protein